MSSRWLDEFLEDKDRPTKVFVDRAAWFTAIAVALAIAAIAFSM
jgi:hypothetical protein